MYAWTAYDFKNIVSLKGNQHYTTFIDVKNLKPFTEKSHFFHIQVALVVLSLNTDQIDWFQWLH